MRMIDADRLKAEIMGWCVVTGRLVRHGKISRKRNCFASNRRVSHNPTLCLWCVGKWKMDTDPDDGDCRCSSCKVCIDALHSRNHGVLNALGYKLHTFYKYCPRCGAKMEDKQ